MQEVFCGVPKGKVVANEFKRSTKKKVFLYLLRPGGETYVKVSNKPASILMEFATSLFATYSLHITLCKRPKIFP